MAALTRSASTSLLPSRSQDSPEVPLRISLPTPVYEKYRAQAGERDVEEFIADHLRQTTAHDHSGAGLYFNADQARRLCSLTGRGPSTDPETVLLRLEPFTQIMIGEVIVELDAAVLDRISHNYLVRKGVKTAAQFIAREALNGIRTAVGLSTK